MCCTTSADLCTMLRAPVCASSPAGVQTAACPAAHLPLPSIVNKRRTGRANSPPTCHVMHHLCAPACRSSAASVSTAACQQYTSSRVVIPIKHVLCKSRQLHAMYSTASAHLCAHLHQLACKQQRSGANSTSAPLPPLSPNRACAVQIFYLHAA
jgi:hypothetical protein